MRVCAFASGRGSNLRAILDAVDRGTCAVEVAAVLSDRAKAPALEFARERGIRTEVVPFRKAERDAWNRDLADAFVRSECSWAVLAGFMRIVGEPLLEATREGVGPSRIVNVHPSLLPVFPGMDAPAQALAAGVSVSGCTVHLVDAGVDTGPILAQAPVPVFSDDTSESLHARIQVAEHSLLPRVLDALGRGQLDGTTWADGGRALSFAGDAA